MRELELTREWTENATADRLCVRIAAARGLCAGVRLLLAPTETSAAAAPLASFVASNSNGARTVSASERATFIARLADRAGDAAAAAPAIDGGVTEDGEDALTLAFTDEDRSAAASALVRLRSYLIAQSAAIDGDDEDAGSDAPPKSLLASFAELAAHAESRAKGKPDDEDESEIADVLATIRCASGFQEPVA